MDPSTALQATRAQITTLFEQASPCSARVIGDRLLKGSAEVRLEGLNTMPFFRRFAKKFARTQQGLIGHNDNGSLEAFFSGPGYFRVAEARDGEAIFDYRNVPTEAPAHWPKVASNARVPYRFVYGNMVDAIRAVSDDVFVGKAFRLGGNAPVDWTHAKAIGVYFVLARTL